MPIRWRWDNGMGPTQQTPEAMVEQHQGLAHKLALSASRRMPSEVDYGDLTTAALIGLWKAAQAYNPKHDTSFNTYATIRIKGEIADATREQARQKGWSRSNGWIRKLAGCDLEVEIGHVSMQMQIHTADNGGSSEALTLADMLASDEDVHEEFAMRETTDSIMRSVSKLPEREQLVFALYVFEGMTLNEIAEVMGVTESRCSQLLTKARQRLTLALGDQLPTGIATPVKHTRHRINRDDAPNRCGPVVSRFVRPDPRPLPDNVARARAKRKARVERRVRPLRLVPMERVQSTPAPIESSRSIWTRESVIAAIRAHVQQTGGKLPTCKQWKVCTEHHPSVKVAKTFFGTWKDAVRAAGFTPDPRGRKPHRDRLESPQLLALAA